MGSKEQICVYIGRWRKRVYAVDTEKEGSALVKAKDIIKNGFIYRNKNKVDIYPPHKILKVTIRNG